MKARLNLTIDAELLEKVKQYAAGKHSSVSELVEDYFRSTLRPAVPGRSIINLIESLPQPEIAPEGDLSKRYFEENASRYGF